MHTMKPKQADTGFTQQVGSPKQVVSDPGKVSVIFDSSDRILRKVSV